MRPIKVLIIQSRVVIGGPSIYAIALAKILNKNRIQTKLIGGSQAANEKSMVQEIQRNGIHCSIIPEMGREIHFYDDLVSLIKLYRIIIKEKPEIVHTHTAKAGALGRIAAFLAGVPYIYHTFHGHVFEGYFGKIKSNLFVLFEKLLAKITTKILVLCKSQMTDIVSEYRVAPESKVEIIPLGFEWRRFFEHPKYSFFRKQFKIDKDKFVIAFIGRIVSIKNYPLFLDIAKKLLTLDPNRFHFVVIGDGELKSDFERKVADYELSEKFTFCGWLSVDRSVYRAIDLLLLTSKNEGTPVAVIEALVSGTPVVARNVGGVPDILKLYDEKCIIERDAPESYVTKIMEIASQNTRIPLNIRDKIKDYYSMNRLEKDMFLLFHDLIKKD